MSQTMIFRGPGRRIPGLNKVLGAAIIGALLGGAQFAGAATVTWGAATTILSDSDISISGTLVAAYSLSSSTQTDVTVNGVTFSHFNTQFGSTSDSLGGFTVAVDAGDNFDPTNTLGASNSAPFTSLSPAYQSLLQGLSSTINSSGSLTLTMSNLLIGQEYLVEFWSNDADAFMSQDFATQTHITSGNAVALAVNSTGTNGGSGQWATGTFVADANTQIFSLTSTAPTNGRPILNAFEVRAVPEPAAWALLGLGASLIGLRALRRSAKIA